MNHTMVPSDRVEHVAVYGRDGAKLGTVERLMLDKVSGTVAYAVIKTGGLLGCHHHYPVLWSALRYDPERQAYVPAGGRRYGDCHRRTPSFPLSGQLSVLVVALSTVITCRPRGCVRARRRGGRGSRVDER